MKLFNIIYTLGVLFQMKPSLFACTLMVCAIVGLILYCAYKAIVIAATPSKYSSRQEIFTVSPTDYYDRFVQKIEWTVTMERVYINNKGSFYYSFDVQGVYQHVSHNQHVSWNRHCTIESFKASSAYSKIQRTIAGCILDQLEKESQHV